MKIENPLLTQVSSGAAQQTGATGAPGQQSKGQSKLDGLLDEVQLSNLSAALRELSAREAVREPGSSERSAEIAKRIEEGRYEVDAAGLSKKIIQETTSLS